MYKYTIVLLLFVTTINAKAQFTVNKKTDTGSTTVKSNAGGLIAEITNVVKTEALKGSFSKQKKSFSQATNKTEKTEDLVKAVVSLCSNVKPNYFKDAAASEKLISVAAKIQKKTELADFLKKFESNLKPQAFSSIWQLQRAAWLQSVGKLEIAKPIGLNIIQS